MKLAHGWMFAPLMLGACAQIVGIEDPKPIADKPAESSSSAGSTSSSSSGGGSSSSGGPSKSGPWVSWPMPSPKGAGDPNSVNYISDEAKGIVTDLVTGLIWQREGDNKWYVWNEAQTYCNELVLGGYDDWRVPWRIELISLIDYTRINPAIDPAFPNTIADGYWTATRMAYDSGQAWVVYFDDGDVPFSPLSTLFQIRCVRSN